MTAPAPATGGTIYALSSGQGRAGVAVIRLSGPAAPDAVRALAGEPPPARYAALRRLRHPADGRLLDEALVIVFHGPASETGEDMAELHVHGGRAVIAAVLDAIALVPGCRPAEPGEFARRGFDNGKLDLTALEGLADLIEADTEAQRRQAVRHASAMVRRRLDGWRESIAGARALIEAAIDFSDEADVAADTDRRARHMIAAVSDELATELARPERGERLRDGFHVVIAGAPNAGKSSLLNLLARRDVAIVSPEAGTTRDVIEVRLDLGGLPVTVSDTAGIRVAAGGIEQEGIRRALATGGAADLVIWLVDALAPQPSPPPGLPADPARLWTVLNKIDLAAPALPARHRISCRTASGIEGLLSDLQSAAGDALGTGETGLIANHRHRRHLAACDAHLHRFLEDPGRGPEIAAEELRLASVEIGRLTGAVEPEEVLGLIFSRFCIGK